MAFLIDDNFDEYGAGSGLPNPPWQTVQVAIVGQPGINPSPQNSISSSPGFNFDVFQTTLPTSRIGSFIHIWCGFTLGGSFSLLSGALLTGSNTNPLAPQFRQPWFRVGIDGNLGISITTANGSGGNANYLIDPHTNIPANSVLQSGVSLSYGPWYFLQADLSFVKHANSDGSYSVEVNGTVYLDGQFACGGAADSGILFLDIDGNPQTYTTFCDLNLFEFISPSLGGRMDNVSVIVDDNPTDPLPHTDQPNPMPPPPTIPVIPNVLLSQIPLEIVKLKTGGNARMSQAVLEHVRRITNTKAILSQAVIELVAQNPNRPSTGWQIKEI